MKQMKKKKIRVSTRFKPVKSHVVIRVSKHNPNMAILNFSGFHLLICYKLKPGLSYLPLIEMDSRIVNEFGDNSFSDGNWRYLAIPLSTGKTHDIYKIYQAMRWFGKRLAKLGILEED